MSLMNPSGLWFGLVDAGELPELPNGYNYLIRQGQFVRVVGPNGFIWLLVTIPRPHLIAADGMVGRDPIYL